MSQVMKLMKEYFKPEDDSAGVRFENEILSKGLLLERNLPVQPTKVKWTIEEGPERFVRRFQFDGRRRLIDFVNDVLRFEDEIGHHGEMRINYDAIDLSVHTHNLEKITELDREYIHEIDKLYQDVMHYGYEEDRD